MQKDQWYSSSGRSLPGDTATPTPGSERLIHHRLSESKRSFSLVQLWYRLLAPPEPPAYASLQERETARRGRIGSVVGPLAFFLALIAVPVALSSSNYPLLVILAGGISAQIVGIIFNRVGKITTAGILLVVGSESGLMTAFFFLQSGGISVYNLMHYDLLIQPELFAVSLLAPWSVLVVAAVNVIFILVSFNLMPHAPDLAAMSQAQQYEAILRPITVQIVVAVIAYLGYHSARKAIERADRAEVIAQLTQQLADQDHAVAVQKQQLEEGVRQLSQVHALAANGQLNVRAQLPQERILWPLVATSNMLFTRLQRALRSESELQRTYQATALLVEHLQQRRNNTLVSVQPTGTVIDSVIMEVKLDQMTKKKELP